MHVNSSRKIPPGSVLLLGMHHGRKPTKGSSSHLKKVGGWLGDVLDDAGFRGELGTSVTVPWPDGEASRVVVVGLGEEAGAEELRQAAAIGRQAAGKSAAIATTLHQVPLDGAIEAVLDGVGLADYRFERYKSSTEDRPDLTLTLLAAPKEWKEQAERSRIVVEAVLAARDLVNMPASDKPPLTFATLVGERAEAAGMDVEVIAGDRLEAEQLNGLRGVGSGSSRPPCMIHLVHKPKRARAKLVFVGKGIVFDSGGLSIKPASSMESMKDDMAGAAAVSSAAIAIAQLGLPVEVHAMAAMAENLPGAGAQRPGDVIRYRNGKTIEVLNTDAEGRLVLADGLCLATEMEPDLIVDLATLTGAITVALGQKIAGVFGNDVDAVDRLIAAAEAAGERMWPMPLPDDYRSMIDSQIADMKNTGKGRYGGAITASLLLREFVGDRSWVHIDIAGPASVDDAEHYIPKGGTGFGVRTLIALAESYAS